MAVVFGGYVRPLEAATITVDSATDDGIGCTLREAIANANTNSDGSSNGCAAGDGLSDTIVFDGTLSNATITLNSTLSVDDISGDGTTTVDGSGAPGISVSGGNAVQILDVTSGETLSLNNMTLTSGAAYAFTGITYGGAVGADFGTTVSANGVIFEGNNSVSGGAVFSNGTVSLTNSTFNANSASREGGAVFSNGTVSLSNSTFSSNSASRVGGAIFSGDRLTVSSSTFERNNTPVATGRGGRLGGAIFARGNIAEINDSNFSMNSANSGGAVFLFASSNSISNSTFVNNYAMFGGAISGDVRTATGGIVVISDTTFEQNSSASRGGAIDARGSLSVAASTFSANGSEFGGAIGLSYQSAGDTVRLENSTFSGNTATIDGGAVFAYGDSFELSLRHTTLVGNSATSSGGIFAGGNLGHTVNLLNSVFAGGSSCYFLGPMTVNISGSFFEDNTCNGTADGPALLDTLADNGGPTLTHGLLPGSPLRDAGEALNCSTVTTDQRGSPRPVESTGDGTVECDIGAVEVAYGTTPVSLESFSVD